MWNMTVCIRFTCVAIRGEFKFESFQVSYMIDKLILLERGQSLERLSLHTGAFIIQWTDSPLKNCIYHGRHERFCRNSLAHDEKYDHKNLCP